MATPLPTQGLSDYDARLLELAHQLDAERREIIMQFVQDLFLIGEEREFDSSEITILNKARH